MLSNKKYLAIIPARGGSKRLPRKNILQLAGKPLIAWTIEAALQSQSVNKVLVTSDDAEILDISLKFGADTLKRPVELSQDTSTSFDAIKHAIESVPRHEYTILLQPTSPLRNGNDIDTAINILEKKRANGVISVTEVEHSPLWMNTLSSDDCMDDFLGKEIINMRSQDLPKYYRLNGAIYIFRTDELLKQGAFFGMENIYAYRMSNERSVDIDTEMDFLKADFLMKNVGLK